MKKIILILLLLNHVCFGQDTTKMKQLYFEAAEFEDKGDLVNAIKTQLRLFNLDTSNYVSANVIAGLYGKMERFDQEVQWAKKSVQINPKFSDGYINLGNGYFGLSNLVLAEKCFLQCQKLDSTNHYAYYSLGLIEETKKNLSGAISYYEKSVKVNNKFTDGYFNLAAAYANAKQLKKAYESISKVLELNPQDQEAKEMQRQILADLKKTQ